MNIFLTNFNLIFILIAFITFTNAISNRQLSSTIFKTTLTSTLSSSSSTLPSNIPSYHNKFSEFNSFSTSNLPIIPFRPGDGYFYDYMVQVGEPKQEIALRLDIIQGDNWIPATSAFVTCNSNYIVRQNVTLTKASSLKTSTTPITSTTSINSINSINSIKNSSTSVSITIDNVDVVYGKSCSTYNVFDIFSSLYYSFIDIITFTEVKLINATQYFNLFISGILVTGVWAIDNFFLTFGLNNIETYEFINVPFVYTNFSNVGVGSLALGSSQSTYSYEYNFISNFVINNLIDSNSYSLALGADNFSLPHLILGGINKNLIYNDGSSNSNSNSNSLMALFDFIPVLDETGNSIKNNNGLSNSIPSLPIFGWGVTSNLTGKSVIFSSSYNDRMEISNYPKPALIDTRHSYNYIPYSTLIELAIELNAYYSSSLDVWIADCSTGSTGTIDVNLGNYTIHMPISSFLIQATSNNSAIVFSSGDQACYLTFLPDYRLGYSLLGTTFLKNVYLAIDNENKKIALSPLNGQLKDLDLCISYTSSTTLTTSKITDSIISRTSKNLITDLPSISTINEPISSINRNNITYGLSSVSRQSINDIFTATTITILSNSDVSTYETIITLDSEKPRHNHQSITSPVLYAIKSGVIPFGKRFTSVTPLTLTIPTTIVFTDTFVQSTQVYISNGEVYFQTQDPNNGNDGNDGNDDTHTGNKRTAATESTIYAFSSLVVTPLSSSKSSGAGSNLQVPDLMRYNQPTNLLNTFKIFGYFSIIFISIIILL